MAVLAGNPRAVLRARAIAERLGASAAHLAKVLSALERAGLVTGARGPTGGYQLARAASRVSLKDIYEAVEGPMAVRACLFGEPVCRRGGCTLSEHFGRLNRDVVRMLGRTRLTNLVKQFGEENGK